MGPALRLWLGAAFWVGLAREAPAAGPSPEALEAWQQHLQAVEARLGERLDGKRPFLWADEAPKRRERLRQGEILTAPQLPGGRRDVAGGLIHNWIGAVFLPESSLGQVLAVVHDYDHYREFFKPTVVRSKLLERLEAAALSRSVPAYLRWLVNPVVSRLSRNSLVTSLEQTRQAVMRKRAVR